MLVSQGIMDAIKPNGYVRPPIELDGYAFRWNNVSFGIPPQDASLFKAFLRDAAPMLDVMVHQARQAQDIGEKGTNLTRYQLYEKFTPRSTLVLTHGRASYVICMTSDENLFVDAEEQIDVDENGRFPSYSLLNLNWNVGELEKKTELT